MSDMIVWALRELAASFEQNERSAFQRSRAIREAQEKDPQTGEIVNATPDDMYELGSCEGTNIGFGNAARRVRELANVIEREQKAVSR